MLLHHYTNETDKTITVQVRSQFRTRPLLHVSLLQVVVECFISSGNVDQHQNINIKKRNKRLEEGH